MDLALIMPDEKGWVNARWLHGELKVKTRFNDWIKRRLKRRFKEGVDYLVLKEKYDDLIEKIDYMVSEFVAEHMCLLENNRTGDKIRDKYVEWRKERFDLKLENKQLKAQLVAATAPKPKRLSDGRLMERFIEIKETHDIFGNVEVERRTVKKYRTEMSAQEQRLAELQHMSRVQEGISKAIKEKACGDDLPPPRLKLVSRSS